jgi:dTDP-4-amino-4,6-dideoxygalactose transaminase
MNIVDELHKLGYTQASDPWDAVEIFESQLAQYAGAAHAVCTDSCSNALFLCLRYLDIKNTTIEIPAHTYSSVPMQIVHSGNRIRFAEKAWDGHYELGDTGVVDAATQFYQGMYQHGKFMCTSFHHRKTLKLERGGVILTDDPEFKAWALPMIYDGRHRDTMYAQDTLACIGYHMYMPPGVALEGMQKLAALPDHNPTTGGSHTYGDLREQKIFHEYTDN